MEQYTVLSSALFWVIMAAVIALHITAHFAARLGKGIYAIVCAVNMLLHFGLFGLFLAFKAEPEELFFALLLSTAAALFTTKHKDKGDAQDGI